MYGHRADIDCFQRIECQTPLSLITTAHFPIDVLVSLKRDKTAARRFFTGAFARSHVADGGDHQIGHPPTRALSRTCRPAPCTSPGMRSSRTCAADATMPLGLAGRSDTMFSDDAVALIHQVSRGLPRAVNNLATHAPIAALRHRQKHRRRVLHARRGHRSHRRIAHRHPDEKADNLTKKAPPPHSEVRGLHTYPPLIVNVAIMCYASCRGTKIAASSRHPRPAHSPHRTEDHSAQIQWHSVTRRHRLCLSQRRTRRGVVRSSARHAKPVSNSPGCAGSPGTASTGTNKVPDPAVSADSQRSFYQRLGHTSPSPFDAAMVFLPPGFRAHLQGSVRSPR